MSNMKHPIPQGKSKARGFTMVELVVVIAVIGILAAVAIVKFNSIRGDANMSIAQANGSMLKRAVGTLCGRGNLPASDVPAAADYQALLDGGATALNIRGIGPTVVGFSCDSSAGSLVWETTCTNPTNNDSGTTITYTASTNTVACSTP